MVFVEDRFDQYISFYKFSNIDNSEKIISFLDLRWDLLVEQYYSIFGKKNVLVLPYEFLQESPLDFEKYFTKFFNLKIKDKLNLLKKEKVFNESESIYKNKLSTKKILSSLFHQNYEKFFYQTSCIINNINKRNEIKNYKSSISDKEYLFNSQKKLKKYNQKLDEICDYDFSNYLY